MVDNTQANLYHYDQNDTVYFSFSLSHSNYLLSYCDVLQSANRLFRRSLLGCWFFCCRPRPGRGQMFEAKAEAEAKALRPRSRPRPKCWPRGHFGLDDLTSLINNTADDDDDDDDCTTDIQINNCTRPPTYLSDLLQFRTASRRLRSSDHCLLHNAGAMLFSAVGRSATPFPQFGTHYQLISLIIRTTCFYLQPQNVFLLTFIHDLVINCVRACDCEIAAVLRRSTVDCTTNTNCTGDTRFLCGCARCMDNGLPSNVWSCNSLLTFRRHLKTHYFTAAYICVT